MTTVVVQANDLVNAWRGAKGSGDMMAGRGRLILSFPAATVEICGTPAELEALKARLVEALEAESW